MFSHPLLSHPSRKLLLALFVFWKVLLLSIVYLNPDGATGYDSSTQLLFQLPTQSTVNNPIDPAAGVSSSRIVTALTRWDAIYFTSAAQRGYVHEQEWAFSWALTSVLRYITATIHGADHVLFTGDPSSDLRAPPHDPSATSIAQTGIIISHLSHLASILVLYQLVLLLYPGRRNLAFICAALHVLSPAGVFLNAPNAEAPFALLSFIGTYCYVATWSAKRYEDHADVHGIKGPELTTPGPLFTWDWTADTLTIVSGLCFGGATLLRSNGLFYGTIFAYDALLWGLDVAKRIYRNSVGLTVVIATGAVISAAVSYVLGDRISSAVSGKALVGFLYPAVFLVLPGSVLWLFSPIFQRTQELLTEDVRKRQTTNIVATVVAGSFIAGGYIWPQYVAYKQFCINNVDASNVPWCSDLLPSIYSSIQSRYWNVGLFRYWTISNLPLFLVATPMLLTLLWSGGLPFLSLSKQQAAENQPGLQTSSSILRRLAVPQLVTASLALTTFHVQIINRISSGYVLWYLHLASYLLDDQTSSGRQGSRWRKAGVSAMIIYACVQAVLYSAFLPPA